MDNNRFQELLDKVHAKLKDLTRSKGEEYTRRENNQFANFERGAMALGLTREQVLMVYLSKHLDSITTYVKDQAKGEKRDYAEPITGRIDDAILYLILLRGMVIPRASSGADLAGSYSGSAPRPSAPPVAAPGADARIREAWGAGEVAKEASMDLSGVLMPKEGAPLILESGSTEIDALQAEIAEWANGLMPHRTPHNAISKLTMEELPELLQNPLDPMEYADLMILALDYGYLIGVKPAEAIRAKMRINRERKWGIDPATGSLKHVKEQNEH